MPRIRREQEYVAKEGNDYDPLKFLGSYGSFLDADFIDEEITIAVGTGAAGVDSAADLIPAGSAILGVVVRVTQAPGGGATTLDAGRKNGANLDEYIDGIAVSTGTTGDSFTNGDGSATYGQLNPAADKMTLTTDVNVAVSDMIVRVVVFYKTLGAPTS